MLSLFELVVEETGDVFGIPAFNYKKLNPTIYELGVKDGEAKCASRHFVSKDVVLSEDRRTISFKVPTEFEPDIITVHCLDVATAISQSVTILSATMNRQSNGTVCGMVLAGNAGATTVAAFSTENSNRYSRTDDGTITFGNCMVGSKGTTATYFSADASYVVVCEKFTE